MTMRFGYMPSFNMDLLGEIKFAKGHFDFIEITLKKDLGQYNHEYLKKIKFALNEFELFGHLHWEIDFNKPKDVKKALKNIEIYDFLGCKKITIHPSNNYQAIEKIKNYCENKKIELFVENTASPPFNRPKELKSLLKKISPKGLTLDIGHAENNWSDFVKLFGNKIKHIHLHNSYKGNDHLPFFDGKSLKEIFIQLSQIKKDLTISLEIFQVLKNQKSIPIDSKMRRKIILGQLEMIEKSGPF